MGKNLKRFIAIVLAVTLSCGSFVCAFADTNDELLAQYYAALAKKQGQTTNNASSNEALLAQYYAALAKMQGKAPTQAQTKTNGEVVHATDATFNAEVIDYKGVVVVDFYADWCGPCRKMAPIMENIAKNHPEYKVVKVNVDENDSLSYAYSITSIPLFIIFKDGKVKYSTVGSCSEKTMLSLLQKYGK